MRRFALAYVWAVLLAAPLWAQNQTGEQLSELITGTDGQQDAQQAGEAEPIEQQSQVDTAVDRIWEGDVTVNNVWSLADALWDSELFQSGDSPVKVSQLVIAILIAILGVMIARFVAGFVRRRVQSHSRINAQTAEVIQKLIFYLLAIVVVLVALPIAGIPITIFTVIGGALAIGVGFGAQNLFNNLISGFIILMERPIRINDIVEVDDHRGKVMAIGNRSTRIRRFDGIDVLVPNSYFLENAVVNWTLSDHDVRGEVMVGAAYGSPTQQVHDLMLQAVKNTDGVKLQPREPEVIFEEFADNTLNFRVYFWTAVQRPLDMARIESDVRFRIDKLFADHGITIAFPQRDVHLDSTAPVKVQVVREQDGS